jgi:hypothetical protein
MNSVLSGGGLQQSLELEGEEKAQRAVHFGGSRYAIPFV